jgi:hypothetical protein
MQNRIDQRQRQAQNFLSWINKMNVENKFRANIFAKLIVILSLAWSTAAAAELYKCKDASGKTTYQETPCAVEQTQKKLRKDAANGDDSSPALTARASGDTITLANGEKRYPLDRTPPKSQVASCVAMHRPDLANALTNALTNSSDVFDVDSKLYKRLWQLDSGATAERNIVVVNVQEKNKLGYAERASFTCTLRGDQSIDLDASKEFLRSR